MAQDIGHFFEADAPIDHLRGRGMAEGMGTQTRIAGDTHPT